MKKILLRIGVIAKNVKRRMIHPKIVIAYAVSGELSEFGHLHRKMMHDIEIRTSWVDPVDHIFEVIVSSKFAIHSTIFVLS